jgi:hypothetical protein
MVISRNGYTEQEIKDALVDERRELDFRIDLLDSSNVKLKEISTIDGLNVSYDKESRDVNRALKASFKDDLGFTERFEFDHSSDWISYGDTTATWDWQTADSQLVSIGGSEAKLIRDELIYTDVDIEVDSHYATDGGIVARFQDNNNYYLCAIRDDSSSLPTQNLQVYKRINGTYTSLGSANVTWVRGIQHTIRFRVIGSRLQASFDGTVVIDVTDTAIMSAGGVGLRANGSSTTTTTLGRYDDFAYEDGSYNTYNPATTVITGENTYYQEIRVTSKDTIDFLKRRLQPYVKLLMPALSSYTATTQADFQAGTLTSVTANSNGTLALGASAPYNASGNWVSPEFSPATVDPNYIYGIDACGSLSQWTVVGATVASSNGNPAPSFQATSGQYAFRKVGVAPNQTLEFDVFLLSGTPLANLFFMCNASGAGQMFRIEGRAGNSSGFASTTSWTSWLAPSGFSNVSVGVWHRVKLVIGSTTVEGFIDGASYGTYTFANTGDYIAVHGDGGTGGRFDNISIKDNNNADYLKSSIISWNADVPAACTLTVDVKIGTGSYQRATNDGPVPGLSVGDNLAGKTVTLKVSMTTSDTNQTATLNDISLRFLSSSNSKWIEFAQGVFVIPTARPSSNAGGTVTYQLDGFDLNHLLGDTVIKNRYYLAAGTNYVTAIKAALAVAGITSINITANTAVLSTSQEWEPGTSIYQIVDELCAAIGYVHYFDENGSFVALAWVNPQEQSPIFSFKTNKLSLVEPEANLELDAYGVPNIVVLIVSEPELTSPLRSERSNNNVDSPTSIPSRGREIVRVIKDVQAPDQTTLDQIATQTLFELSQIYESVELNVGIVPFMGHGDSIDLEFDPFRLRARYEVLSWEVEMAPGGKMRLHVRRIVTV